MKLGCSFNFCECDNIGLMKIGLVCPFDFSLPGGVKNHVLALYQEFKKLGHKVRVIAPYKTGVPQNPDYIYLGKALRFPSGTGSWGALSLELDKEKIEKVLNKEKFDILHFHEPLVPFLSWQILMASSSCNIATFHSFWKDKSFWLANFKPLLRYFAKNFEKKFKGLIVVSEAAKYCWQGFFKSKMKIIPNGIDLNKFKRQKVEGKIKDKEIIILFVGRMEKRKGVLYLIQAFKRVARKRKNLKLVLIGDGPQKIQAKLLVKAFNLEKQVVFFSKVSDKRLINFYHQADICCFPSIGGESFGIVLLEAMAAGKPLVCYANPGYMTVMGNYPFGKGLVKPRSIQGLAKALEVLIEDKALRRKLSQWGKREVKKYAWPKVAREVLGFYRKSC